MNDIARVDQMLFHLVNGAWTNPLLDLLMPALSWIGNMGAVWIVLLGAVGVVGRKAGRRVALTGLVALAIGFLCSTLIKDMTLRPRPSPGLDHPRLLVVAPHSYAFPSGHTTSAFSAASGATLAARRLLKRVPICEWGMFALAVAISYSRLYIGVHWPTDVAGGVLLGLTSGWAGFRLVFQRWNRKPRAQREGENPRRSREYNMRHER